MIFLQKSLVLCLVSLLSMFLGLVVQHVYVHFGENHLQTNSGVDVREFPKRSLVQRDNAHLVQPRQASPAAVGTAGRVQLNQPSESRLRPIPDIFVAVTSGMEKRGRRDTWRSTCAKYLREAKYVKGANIEFKFFVGKPVTTNGDRNKYTPVALDAPDSDKSASLELIVEYNEHRDLEFLPVPDNYLDLPGKTVLMLQRGYVSGAKMVVKVDDDTCFNPSVVVDKIRSGFYEKEQGPIHMLYAGFRELNHEGTRFLGGPLYVLSRNLLDEFFREENNPMLVLSDAYGGTGEDVDRALFVEWLRKKNPELIINIESIPEIGIEKYNGKPYDARPLR